MGTVIYWTMTSLQEKCGKMRLYEEGLSHGNLLSLVSSLKGVSKGKILRKSMHNDA
jgi:hypothetical protein